MQEPLAGAADAGYRDCSADAEWQAPFWSLERWHCVACAELQLVGGAAGSISPPAQFSGGGLKTWRAIALLRKAARTQHLIRNFKGLARPTGKLASKVLPNPSVNRSPNGGPPAPGRWYAVHFHRPGAGVPPSVPGYLER
jgi:hypothetical protein